MFCWFLAGVLWANQQHSAQETGRGRSDSHPKSLQETPPAANAQTGLPQVPREGAREPGGTASGGIRWSLASTDQSAIWEWCAGGAGGASEWGGPAHGSTFSVHRCCGWGQSEGVNRLRVSKCPCTFSPCPSFFPSGTDLTHFLVSESRPVLIGYTKGHHQMVLVWSNSRLVLVPRPALWATFKGSRPRLRLKSIFYSALYWDFWSRLDETLLSLPWHNRKERNVFVLPPHPLQNFEVFAINLGIWFMLGMP